jgi:DNA-binding MarR family transcriptional regulator/N-acetylglutamate synthase-like GNAT family acetyltransferase
MQKSDTAVLAVRRFTRFYTAALGTLEEGLLRSPLSLPEARLLYEVANAEEPTATEIAQRLRLDLGYVSRLLSRLEERKLIRRTNSEKDARQNLIALTVAGRKQFATLDRRSSEEVKAMVAPLSQEQRATLVRSMGAIEGILGGEDVASRKPFVLRTHRAGDMGWVVSRQALLYTREYGWDGRYEALAARIVADFIEQYEPERERCWIAERDGEPVGCVFLVRERAARNTARLRLLHVEAAARGLGLGKALVRQCTEFARQVKYERIVLWTNSVLTAARHLYEEEGYKLVAEEEKENFGKKLTSQTWELML